MVPWCSKYKTGLSYRWALWWWLPGASVRAQVLELDKTWATSSSTASLAVQSYLIFIILRATFLLQTSLGIFSKVTCPLPCLWVARLPFDGGCKPICWPSQHSLQLKHKEEASFAQWNLKKFWLRSFRKILVSYKRRSWTRKSPIPCFLSPEIIL